MRLTRIMKLYKQAKINEEKKLKKAEEELLFRRRTSSCIIPANMMKEDDQESSNSVVDIPVPDSNFAPLASASPSFKSAS